MQRLLRGRRRAAEVREDFLPRKLAKYLPRSIELCRQEYEEIVVRRQGSVTELIRDHYDADVTLDPGSPAARYKRNLLEAVFGRVRAVTSAAGVPALVVVIPSPIDVCDGYDVKVDSALYPEYTRSRLSDEAAAAARRPGLPVVDLFEPFHASGADRLYYHHGNDHWNATGQDLAAQQVAERILALRWPECAVQGARAGAHPLAQVAGSPLASQTTPDPSRMARTAPKAP
jgi:SGNH hydrolase-like domain, acetyltransferase AlgX